MALIFWKGWLSLHQRRNQVQQPPRGVKARSNTNLGATVGGLGTLETEFVESRQVIGDIEPGDAFAVIPVLIRDEILRPIKGTDREFGDLHVLAAELGETGLPSQRRATNRAEPPFHAGRGLVSLGWFLRVLHLFAVEGHPNHGGRTGIAPAVRTVAISDIFRLARDLVTYCATPTAAGNRQC